MPHILDSRRHEILSHEICTSSLSLTLRLSPARSLSDVWPINNPPSLPALADSLLSSPSSPSPSSYRSATFSSLLSLSLLLSPSSHSSHSFPLTHFSSLSRSHALSRWNSAVSPHRCRIGSNAHKRARNENTARCGKQAGGGERGAEEGGKTPPLLFDSPKLTKTGERHGRRRPGRSLRVCTLAWL